MSHMTQEGQTKALWKSKGKFYFRKSNQASQWNNNARSKKRTKPINIWNQNQSEYSGERQETLKPPG